MDVLVLKINRKMNGGDVSETKDPAIKLFGKRIPVPECHFPEKSDVGCQTPYKSEVTDICNDITKTETGDVHMEESGNQDSSSVKEDNKQITRDEDGPEANGKPMEDPSESSSVENKKTLKKPDKILACPRCNSLETKFCYFNNYNVNQPRHYCKNCQRYWTAGGTVRNVPVGAGRRKNKNLVSQYNSQVLASPEPATQANPQDFSCSDSCTLRPSTSHGTVLKFGPEGPLYEPMATVDLMDQKGYVSDLSSTRGQKEEPSATSIPACSVQENQIKENVKEQDSLIGSSIEPPQPNPQQYYPVPPWVFPLNQVWHSGASFVAAQCSSQPVLAPAACNPVQRGPTPLLPVPTFCAPAIPLQFVPTSYWGYLPVWTAGKRHMSTVEPVSDGELTSGSGNDSPTLGKHSRDRNSFDEEESEKGVLVPKTLRIDDPEEASKSSIWATLGFNTNRKESESRCGIFRPYKSSAEWKGPSTTAEALEPNPAALSRSHTFQEST